MSAKIDPFGFVISYRCLIRISTYIMRKGNRKKSTEWYCGGREWERERMRGREKAGVVETTKYYKNELEYHWNTGQIY